MQIPCSCGVKYLYYGGREKDDLAYYFYYCPVCQTPTHTIGYKYNPTNCPKHSFEFIGEEFIDDHHAYKLNQIDRCSRCGALRSTPRDTRGAGIAGRIEIDDPRVAGKILFNRSSWDRFIPKEIRELSANPPPKHVVLPAEDAV